MATDHLDPQTQYEALLVTTKTTVLAYLDLLEDPSTVVQNPNNPNVSCWVPDSH